MRIEIRPVGLRAMRKNRGLTERQLRDTIRVSLNYISALEEGAKRPGKDVQQRLINYFGCRFEDLFAVVLVDLETAEVPPLALSSEAKPLPATASRRSGRRLPPVARSRDYRV